MTVKQLASAGGLLLLIGVLLGLVPGTAKDVDCGSPWIRNASAIETANFGSEMATDLISGYGGPRFAPTDYGKVCSEALSARGAWGGALAGLGALALLGAAIVSSSASARVHQDQADSQYTQNEPTDRQRTGEPAPERDSAGHERHGER